jgi:hypothetical protein
MGSLMACVCRTIDYIVGVAKEKSERQEFSMLSVHSNQCLIQKFIFNVDSWNDIKSRQANDYKT